MRENTRTKLEILGINPSRFNSEEQAELETLASRIATRLQAPINGTPPLDLLNQTEITAYQSFVMKELNYALAAIKIPA